MDVCLTFFAVPLPPAPVPTITAFLWDYVDPVLQVCMTFPVDMDTTSLPPRAKFKINIDTVDKNVATLEWLNNRVLGASFSEAALGPTTVRFEYTTQTGKLRTALGADVEPFDLLGTEFPTSGRWSYVDPNLQFLIDFPIDMDQTVLPAPSDLILQIDESPVSIDIINWGGPRLLGLLHTEVGLTPTTADIEFPVPIPDLRTITLSQICPFAFVGTPI